MNRHMEYFLVCCLIGSLTVEVLADEGRLDDPWKKHTIFTGQRNQTAVGADFTGDGKPDVIASCGGFTRLFVAPTWKEMQLYEGPNRGWGCIHSEVMDVDRDGDLDYVAAVAQQGVFWLENPEQPLREKWQYHVIDNEITTTTHLQQLPMRELILKVHRGSGYLPGTSL